MGFQPRWYCAAEYNQYFFGEQAAGCFEHRLLLSSGQHWYLPIDGPGPQYLINAGLLGPCSAAATLAKANALLHRIEYCELRSLAGSCAPRIFRMKHDWWGNQTSSGF